MKKESTEISIIIPAYNEGNEVKYFLEELYMELGKLNTTFEVIFIDNNTSENSSEIAHDFSKKYANFRAYELSHPGVSVVDKSNKYMLGFREARGEIIIHLDADGQDRPEEISKFVDRIREGYDLAIGYKQNRKDSFMYKFPSKGLNFIVRLLTGTKVHDMNNGFKAYKANVAKSLNLYSGNFRYIPILLNSRGYRISEIPVKHIERKFGKGKFNFMSRAKGGVFDLISTLLVVLGGKTPVYFYSYTAIVLMLISVSLVYLLITTELAVSHSILLGTLISVVLSTAIGSFLFGIALENTRALTSRNDLDTIITRKF